jgi:opacity protein-like surface antigen
MRHLTTSLLAGLALSFGTANLSAQGLLAVQRAADFRTEQPLTWTVGVSGGYDNLDYKASDDVFFPDIESYFIQSGVGMTYTDADRRTPWSLSLDGGVLHYLDDAPRNDDTFYSARAAFNISHEISQRMKISNNMFATYEVEPNTAMGASTTLWNGQYFYGYENFNLSYAWSRRITTTTSYTIDTIRYDDNFVSASEDRLSHLVAQQFSYSLKPQTQLIGEYRFRMVDFVNRNDVDYQSHYALAGIDHAWSQRLSTSIRGGVEFFQSDRTSQTAPYGEFALDYSVDRKTSIRWFSAAGFDAAELQSFDSRYSIRTGINANHQVDRRLGINGGLSYAYSDFDGGETTPSITENSILVSAGLSYLLWSNVALNAQYSYTVLDSASIEREFDRNIISLGMSASF